MVRAPLVPVEELPAPPVTGPGVPWSAGLGPDAVMAAEVAGAPVGVKPEEATVAPERVAAVEEPEAVEPEAVEPAAVEPDAIQPDTVEPEAVEPEAAPVPAGVATRFCPMCGDRVPIAADGLHCHLGHRLSPAHAPRRRRRWFFGRG